MYVRRILNVDMLTNGEIVIIFVGHNISSHMKRVDLLSEEKIILHRDVLQLMPRVFHFHIL